MNAVKIAALVANVRKGHPKLQHLTEPECVAFATLSVLVANPQLSGVIAAVDPMAAKQIEDTILYLGALCEERDAANPQATAAAAPAAPRDPKEDPQVGDGVTMGIGSDRYAYEVVAVMKRGKVIVVGSCDDRTMALLPAGQRSEYILTRRKNGKWKTQGQPMDDCRGWGIGHKSPHRAPHF